MTDYNNKGLSGAALKGIAAGTMLIDHVGAILFPAFGVVAFGRFWPVLRIIGRLAFPIYAFLIAEGVAHTKNIKKYELRMLLLALVSEPIYDLVMHGSILEFTNQNILFTMLIGILTLHAGRWARLSGKGYLSYVIAAAGCFLAEALHCDYGIGGILTILIFSNQFLSEEELPMKLLFMAMVHMVLYGSIQGFAAFAAIPIWLYNGERGYNTPLVKWGFYLFYPIHLLLLWACVSL